MKKTTCKKILLIFLFVSGCSSPPTEPVFDNPHDEQGTDYILPAITKITPLNDSVINSRDVTISWVGTSVVEEYEYSFDGSTLEQTTDNSFSLNDLEEGLHTFFIKPYNAENDTSITFTVNAIPGPGIVFSPRKIDAISEISLVLEEVENFMGAHIEIYCNNDCVDFVAFALSNDAETEYQMIFYENTEDTSRLILDLGYLKEEGFSGSLAVGSFTTNPKSNGEIHIDSDKTFFRDMNNKDITLNGLDFVKVVK